MYKLKPIRRQSRKIGRNEPCPCGRTKMITRRLDKYQGRFISPFDYDDTTEMVRVPIKYKHCCGKIENQRMMAAVRRHISQAIYNAVHGPKQTSKLRRIINLFKRGEKK
ncbi:MAG: hypothetical protein FVQ80_11315 [Planctomycetes bacterium]|nr:hypothetical protein [Planctomycetota bacterium]